MKLYTSAIAVKIILHLTGCVSNIHDTPLEIHVSNLVNRMTISERAGRKAFSRLESIGPQVIPHLICRLDDMRPLAIRDITLENKSQDAFETFRNYSPETVHDALAAILNQITGHHFLFVYNGSTLNEREENKEKWVDWYNSTHDNHMEICR